MTIVFGHYYYIFLLVFIAGSLWVSLSAVPEIIISLALTYMIVGFAGLPIPYLSEMEKYGDFSYGIFLYAYPVQQLCLSVFKKEGGFPLFLATSAIVTLACSIASWHLLEKRALALKSTRGVAHGGRGNSPPTFN